MLDLRNDLQEPVAAHHAEIARLVRDLGRAGASHAAMTGSGSAVFGLFGSAVSAQRAARWLAAADRRVIVTATRGRVRAPA
jgi:4-diphosphocytidyl-2C-methyl-D-erythritol kinase